MARIVKIFCKPAELSAVIEKPKVIERYPAFIVLQASAAEAARIARRYPAEDITDLYKINLPDRVINTAQPRVDRSGKTRPHPAYRGAGKLRPGKHHYLVQFIGPIKDAWLKAVKKAGAEPRAPYENFTYVVRAGDKQLAKLASLPFVRWTGHLPPRARLAPSLQQVLKGKKPPALPRTRTLPDVYTVEFFGKDDRRAGVAPVKRLGFRVLNPATRDKVLIVQAAGAQADRAKKLEQLSAVHGVQAVRRRSLRRPSNDVAAGVMGTALSLGSSGLGLSGAGEIIGICDTGLDTGDPANLHTDFTGRVAWIKSYPITSDFSQYIKNPGGNDGPADLDSGHGTHVTGSVLGNGAASAGLAGVSGAVRGLAYNAKLVFQAVEQELQWKNPADSQRYGRYLLAGIPHDLAALFGDAYKKGARIHSNSWGGGDPGEYDEQCEQLDRFIWERQNFCVVVAAGNDGTDKDGDGKINPMSVTAPGTAKNCITVGACENRRLNFNSETYGEWWPQDYPVAPFHNDPMANDSEQIVPFSSRGPTRDGRVKPDVVAPGTFILSTRSTQIAANNQGWAAFPPSKLYFYMGGTSMATPLTAGAVGIVREYLRKKQHLTNPSAALLKATLILGCRRVKSIPASAALPDNQQGFGRVNLDAGLVPASPVRAVFRDEKAGLKTGEQRRFQVNVKSKQAPLRVVLAYSDYPGATLVNNLNLVVTDPNGKRYVGNQSAGALSMDVKNNVELVEVKSPGAGTWNIDIIGSNVPQGPQPFALVYCAHSA